MSTITKVKANQLVEYKDAAGHLRYGVAVRFYSDWALIGKLQTSFIPGVSNRPVPRHFQALWGVPYTDIIRSVAHVPGSTEPKHQTTGV